MEGEYQTTQQGQTFVVTQTFPEDYRHGHASILPNVPLEAIALWANEPRFLKLPIGSYAFLDTETSGLAGGTGTYAFMIGIGRFIGEATGKQPGPFVLKQFFMQDPDDEAALLESVADYLSPCQALVTFNGKAFDAPILTTRYTLHRIPNPIKGFAHMDLLPLARRLWRDRLPERNLKYLEENILFAPRSMEEVPGYEIPYLYFDYLRTGDARPLKGVFYHNSMDVVAMAGLLTHVAQILADPFGEMVEHKLDVIALARLFEDLGEWEIAARLFEKGLEDTASSKGREPLPEQDFWLAVQRLSILQKRRGDMETAMELWEKAAGQGYVYAHVELAKYFEHTRRDYEMALFWTSKATTLIETLDIQGYEQNFWREELTHREQRLKKKKNSRKTE